jgi:hypothetical protein
MDCEEVLSGDYKGATDTLRRDISEFTIRQICEVMGGSYARPDYQNLMVACLCRHVLHYKHKTSDGTEHEWSIQQERGQLMGSFLSFPILCIINLAINLVFLARTQRQIPVEMVEWELCARFPGDAIMQSLTLQELAQTAWPEGQDGPIPLIVNGDDVLLGTGKGGLHGWGDLIQGVGFTKSVGKNYVNHEFCCINSQFYQRASVGQPWVYFRGPRVENIFNTRWRMEVDPRDKSAQRTGSTDRWEVGPGLAGDLHHDLVASCQGLPGCEAMRVEFISRNRTSLEEPKRPWFVPTLLGGLGLVGERSKNEGLYCALALRLHSTGKGLPVSKVSMTEKTVSPADEAHATCAAEFMRAKGWHTQLVKCNPQVQPTTNEKPKLPLSVLQFSHYGLVGREVSMYSFMRDTTKIRHLMGRASRAQKLEPYYGDVAQLWTHTSNTEKQSNTGYLEGPSPAGEQTS